MPVHRRRCCHMLVPAALSATSATWCKSILASTMHMARALNITLPADLVDMLIAVQINSIAARVDQDTMPLLAALRAAISNAGPWSRCWSMAAS